jgi:hypothetical protein
MTPGDAMIEHAADRLRELSEKAAERGGVAAKLAEPLAEDSTFVRKLKPSLIRARARGEAVAEPPPVDVPPPSPWPKTNGGRRNPLPLVGAALVAGVATAKLLDWRGHAHPRD